MKQLLHYQTGIYSKSKNPVIPIVLYSGKAKKWTGPLNFHDYIQFDKVLRSSFKENVLNFKIRLLNLRQLDLKNFKRTDLTTGTIFHIMANVWSLNEDKISEFCKLWDKSKKKDKEELRQLVVSYIARVNPNFDWKMFIEIERKTLKKGESQMSTLWEGFLEQEKKKSAQEGVQAGMQKGIQAGMQKKNQEVILNMLKKKADITFISEVTGLSEKEIKKLKSLHYSKAKK